MALTNKQKQIIKAGVGLRKRRGANKNFMEIVEDTIKGTPLTNFVAALKTELIAMKNAQKTNITSEITELNK